MSAGGSAVAAEATEGAGSGDPIAARSSTRWSPATWPPVVWPLLVVLAVILVNLPALLGIVNVSPLGPIGATTLGGQPGFLHGVVYDDPNVGITAQALGHLVAEDWLHGRIPWWNPFEGIGVPLAAEMQSGAFFPPTLLLVFSQGQLLFHITLELIAGLGAYFLVRELGFPGAVASVGGILFGLDGTLSRFGNATANPVCFLPVVILGVERLCRRRDFDLPGWLLVVLGLALSIYAGFPELCYLDGLVALVWLVLRVAQGPAAGRWRALWRVAAAGCAGLLVAAPILVAFVGYLPLADLGGHAGAFASARLPTTGVDILGLPFLYGPVSAFTRDSPAVGQAWSSAGGYFTLSSIALAVVGLVGAARERGLRLLLGILSVVILLWEFGIVPVSTILEHVIPGAANIAADRYSLPGPELAVAILACFGLEVLATRSGRARILSVIAGGGVAGLVLGIDLLVAWPVLRTLWQDRSYRKYPQAMFVWALAFVAVICAVALVTGWLGARRGETAARPAGRLRAASAAVAGVLLALDAMVMFGIPQLSAPRSETIDTGPASFLSAHLGEGRFVSFAVYNADYGSYFGLGQIEAIDLPIPKLWASYVRTNLQPGIKIPFHFGQATAALADAIATRLDAYEALDVRYLVVATGGSWPAPLAELIGHLQRVYDDPRFSIYALPHPRPFFSSTGSPCRLSSSEYDSVVAACSGPATLVRSELDLPGWSATVNGQPATLTAVGGGLTSIALPAGNSTVEFSYTPRHTELALALFALGAITLVGVPVEERVRRRRRGPPPAHRSRRRRPDPPRGADGD